MNAFEQKNTKIKAYNYSCDKCHYKCCYKRDYDKHLMTRKHQKRVILNEKIPKSPNVISYICDTCNKSYKNRNGLWYHKKNGNCTFIEEENVIIQKPVVDSDTILKVLEENKELRKILCSQQKQIGELIPKVGGNYNVGSYNNNQFNLNVFLNEQCKDAINWDDFISSIEIGLGQLNTVMNGSITSGVAQVICQGIDELGIYKRPIHCLDTKRKKLCIKQEGSWSQNQEKNNQTLQSSERKLQHKHVLLIQKWQDEHPNWDKSEEETGKYIEMVQKMMDNVDGDKCINEISKSATIPKNNSIASCENKNNETII